MRILNLLMVATLLLSLSSLVFASGKPDGEYFLAAPPKEWKLGRKENESSTALFEFIPPTEGIKTWTEMVTIQKLLGRKNASPEKYLMQTAQLNVDICKGFQTQQIAFEDVNGYPTHGMIQSCGANRITNRGEFLIIRVVSGNDNLYVIQKAWRVAAFDPEKNFPIPRAQIDETIKYLSTAIVCDTRKGTCPQARN